MKKSILITTDKGITVDCVSIIIVPEIALEEAGYIKMFTVKDAANAKHEYHAMAQMAYFQYQDEELDVKEYVSVTILCGEEQIDLTDGMVICRDLIGEFHVLIHSEQNRKKILEAAYRYCTRWVRLDI
ncbi:MAG: hypothetical protein DRQ43_09050 [Gammaproteobacteria bacterium]|nr:MAG: hypothetical protein DRQ43_09050 [Gammaproteobacteria bacterium]